MNRPFVEYKFIPLPEHIVGQVVLALPPDVLGLMKVMGRGLCIGGGFIRAIVEMEEPNDIDLFVANEQFIGRDAIETLGRTRQVKMSSRNATTFGPKDPVHTLPVQVVTRWHYYPEDHVTRFDFTICQAVVWWDGEWKSLANERFITDSQEKRLVYTAPDRPEEPMSSMVRALKFQGRGYSLSGHQMGKVMMRMTQRVAEESAKEDVLVDDQGQPTFDQWKRWSLRSGLGGGY